jgi:hypothetical protein
MEPSPMAAKAYFGRQPAVHYFWRLDQCCVRRLKEALERMDAQIRDGRLAIEPPLPAEFRGLELSDDLKLYFIVKGGEQFAYRNRPQSQCIDAADYHVKIAGKKPAGEPNPEPYVRLPDRTWIPMDWVLAPQPPQLAPKAPAPINAPSPPLPSPSPKRPWASLPLKERTAIEKKLKPFYKKLIGKVSTRERPTTWPRRNSIASSRARFAIWLAPVPASLPSTKNVAAQKPKKLRAENKSD